MSLHVTLPCVAASPELLGTSIGPYQIVEKIGQGGMGAVYKATHTRLPMVVAIKVLLPHCRLDRAAVARFRDEATAMARLRGEGGLVQIHDFDSLPDGTDYLVMEYLQGELLRDHLRGAPPLSERGLADADGANRRLDPAEALRITRQVARVLGLVHRRGIVHRDLTPGNLMLIADPEIPGGRRVKLLDFGLARSLSAQPPTSGIIGTPPYVAPERFQRLPESEKVDTYALGVICHEMLAGHPPLGDRPAPSLPSWAADLVAGMLAWPPARRPGMEEVVARIERIEGRGAVPEVAPPPPRPPLRRHAAPAGALALLSLVAAPDPLPSTGGMAYIEGGTFLMGSTDLEIKLAHERCLVEAGTECRLEHYQRERPVREVRLSPFSLDVTEVTCAPFAAWLNTLSGLQVHEDGSVTDGGVVLLNLQPSYGWFGLVWRDGRFAVRAGHARKPVTQVTWEGARRYCLAHGKRLPTEAEWEFAARGRTRGYRYPWGDEPPSCDGVVFGRGKGRACAHLLMATAEIGSAPQDRSPEGVRDLAGNVSEWVMDQFLPAYPPCPPGGCVDPLVDGVPAAGPPVRVVRGGDWNVASVFGRAAGRSRQPAAEVHGGLGFRCAASLRPP